MENRVIVAGSRKFQNYPFLQSKLKHLLSRLDKENLEIVSGGAYGADKLGEDYAENHDIPLKIFPANWDRYGKSAGYKRNKQMAEYATHLVAFWNGTSKGTKHMIDLAKEHGLKVRVVYVR